MQLDGNLQFNWKIQEIRQTVILRISTSTQRNYLDFPEFLLAYYGLSNASVLKAIAPTSPQ
ncbi:hypothetical protein H6F88_12690 [Oculatella sp. FACHB-28]|uniref:hypothetical protein n=1 Tax=Oculatella sp. FACHB-28 TaxID=2692845 RepID=UPI0016899D20|nr:hypothetical protein [Oculatella sp. FACHB-28]MBD2056861.1 hypothetical protein [Oculatella sp. FACHB-28]